MQVLRPTEVVYWLSQCMRKIKQSEHSTEMELKVFRGLSYDRFRTLQWFQIDTSIREREQFLPLCSVTTFFALMCAAM